MDVKTLSVRGLAYEATEADLRTAFSKAVEIVRPRRDRALITFNNGEDAKETMETAEKIQIKGRPVRISYVTDDPDNEQTDEAGRKIDPKVLKLRGLSAETKREDLKALYDGANFVVRYGDSTDTPSSFALVVFDTEENAKKALEEGEVRDIDGNIVTVQYALAKREKNVKDGEIDLKALRLYGITKEMTDDDLKEVFPNAMEFVRPPKGKKFRKRSKFTPWAYAKFDNEEDAKEALDGGRKRIIRGQSVSVQYAFGGRKSEDVKSENEEKDEPPAKKANVQSQ